MPGVKVLALGRPCRTAVLLAFFFSAAAQSQTAPAKPEAVRGTPEQRTARAFETARRDPLDLRAFLVRMPKGADLHYHTTGGIYAETFIREGEEDGLCIDLAAHAFVRPAPEAKADVSGPSCGAGAAPESRAMSDQNVEDGLIDAFSMRSFMPYAGDSGHDHFFAAFGKFGAVSGKHAGEWLDEIVTRAAAQNEQYLELMV
ncbi:MAG: adenosine deaminase, partial [Candidatus Acidiferrales bacterium]